MSYTFHAVKEKERREGGEGGETEQEGRDDDRDREMRGGKGEVAGEDGRGEEGERWREQETWRSLAFAKLGKARERDRKEGGDKDKE